MKFHTATSVFKFSWDQVVTAFWCRYPNPHSTHVLSEDTVVRRIAGSKLYSKRLLTKTNNIPKWGEKLVGARQVCSVVEESVVDRKAKTLTTYTRNIGLTKLMQVTEKCTYKPCPDNPKLWTVCEKHSWVESNMFALGRALQAFGMERLKKNAVKASRGFEHVLCRLYAPDILKDAKKLTLDKEKLKATAKKAKELAKATATPTVVASVKGV